MIHGNLANLCHGTPFAAARITRKSKFSTSDVHGNCPGTVGRSDRAHVCTAGGHSKSRWFIVSSSPPHLGHDRSVPQCWSAKRLQTATQPVKHCQRKCLIFLGAFRFHTLDNKGLILGSRTCCSTFSSCAKDASSYPDLTVYKPDLVCVQQKPSGLI